MSRILSVLGSVFLGAILLVGVSLPLHPVSAASACQFACSVTLGAGGMNCNPHLDNGIPTVESLPCSTQCRRTCEGIGMAYDTSSVHASTCGPGSVSGVDVCSACSCIPTTALACIGASTGGAHPYCSSQCTTVCAAAAGRLTERQGAGATITCATGLRGTAQCVDVSQSASIRLCTACMTRCSNSTAGDVQRTPLTCYRTCGSGDTPDHSACVGVSATEAGIAETSATTGGSGSGSGRTGSSGSGASTGGSTGGSGSTGAGAGTGSGSTGASAGGSNGGSTGGSTPRSTDGTCNFACQPQTTPTTCTADSDCTSACQRVCGRSFRNGQCVTSGPGAARCAPASAGATRQCVFECSIGPSAQERSCNPQGADAQAPGTVCGGFCQESCRSASIGTVPTDAQFCRGSAPTCIASTGSGTSGSTGGSTGGTGSGSSGSRGTQSSGVSAGGSRLANPLPGVDSVAGLIGRLIKGILGVVGSVALLMFIYGGVRWILSAGNLKEVTGAQHILRNATIGMLLIFFSYSISSLILGFLGEVGGGSSTSRSSDSVGTSGRLATCVEYAVTHGYIGRNEAQDTTASDWACRQTRTAERTNRAVCITHGCPNDPASVLCCAPIANGSTPTPASAPGRAPDTTVAPTGGPSVPGVTTVCADFLRIPIPTDRCTGCVARCQRDTICNSDPTNNVARRPRETATEMQLTAQGSHCREVVCVGSRECSL